MVDGSGCEIGVQGHLHAKLTPAEVKQFAGYEEAKRTVWMAYMVGFTGCMPCAEKMMVAVASSDASMIELARLTYTASMVTGDPETQVGDLPAPLDEDAVRAEIEGATVFNRVHMVAAALADLSHILPEALRTMKAWESEPEQDRNTIFHRTTG